MTEHSCSIIPIGDHSTHFVEVTDLMGKPAMVNVRYIAAMNISPHKQANGEHALIVSLAGKDYLTLSLSAEPILRAAMLKANRHQFKVSA